MKTENQTINETVGFDACVRACSYVLGSYASFLWDAEEDEDDEAEYEMKPPLVPASC